MKPLFFASPVQWRRWLATHHARKDEVLVGFYKRSSGRPSITWPESVDEALCCGWIDGIRRNLDAESYTIRFTPRRQGSIWSAVNVRRVAELTKRKRMRAAGLRAFAARIKAKTAIYSFEQRKKARLPPAYAKRFKANAAAWRFFSARPPWYQRTATYWVISAKQEETRLRRLAALIDASAHGRIIGPMTRSQNR